MHTQALNSIRRRPGFFAETQPWMVTRVGGINRDTRSVSHEASKSFTTTIPGRLRVAFIGASAMAGDWIKMRHDLIDDEAVMSILAATDCVDTEHVIGRLWKLWSWADRHTNNGQSKVDFAWIDSFVGCAGFANALRSVNWLALRGRYARFPKFDHHMSQSAKTRALTANRAAKFRAKKRNGGALLPPLLEERRGEKRRIEKRERSSSLSEGLDLERKKQ